MTKKLSQVSATSNTFFRVAHGMGNIGRQCRNVWDPFCSPESSVKNMYVLESPMQSPNLWKKNIFSDFLIVLSTFFLLLCAFLHTLDLFCYCQCEKILFEIQLFTVLVIHPGFTCFNLLSFLLEMNGIELQSVYNGAF